MRKTIKIFGLPRSCTNVTEIILKRNFNVRVLTNYPDWKHGENKSMTRNLYDKERNIDTDDLKFIICTKHPINWLWSLHTFENSSKNRKLTPEEFIYGTAFHYEGENAIDIHNKLIKHWFTMYKEENILQQVKYEHIISNQIKLLKRLEEKFDLERKNKDLQVVEKRINPGAKISDDKFQKKIVGFNEDLKKYIKNKLDKEALKLSNYSV